MPAPDPRGTAVDRFRPAGLDRARADSLGPGQVHLWMADLRRSPTELETLGPLLSDDEESRRARFHFERHRRRFLVRRGLLRRLLGAYLDRDPARLVFRYGEQGKPELVGDGAESLLFNLSDSGDGALVAVARSPQPHSPRSGRGQARMGVDLEIHRPMRNPAGLGRRVFSPDDARAWYALPEGQRDTAFLRLWTRKEAILKATGEGILAKPRRYSVTIDGASPAELLSIDGDAGAAAGWHLRHFEPPASSDAGPGKGPGAEPGYLATLALDGWGDTEPAVTCWLLEAGALTP